MKRALSLLRPQPHYRAERFAAGLAAAGFDVRPAIGDPQPGDVLLVWNRYGHYDAEARRFEAAGATVLVTENSYLAGAIPGKWHALAIGHHNGAGEWRVGGNERWDALQVELKPWRQDGERVIIGQRGIGEPGIASPPGWAEDAQRRRGGRIRVHPGKHEPAVPLLDDLKHAAEVITWGSTAALVALLHGILVRHEMPRWIGATGNDDRLAMFRRLIWAQWRVEEIESGEAFRHLLGIV